MPSLPLLQHARRRQAASIARLRRMVECESPSDDAAAVNRFVDLVAAETQGFARVKTRPGGRYGRHLLAEITLPGRRKQGQVLALGHSDTVWPLGALQSMPFEEKQGRLRGPGVLDMKGGIAIFLAACETLIALDIPAPHKVLLQLNSDEEVGSHSSRPLTEKNARQSAAVLVLEPGTGLTGKLKTARKGVGDYHLTVTGQASHAGVDFEAGASAVLELARQIDRIAHFTDLARGITVNPGVISGGTRSNVVAAEAAAHIDIRIARARDAARVERQFRSLRPCDPRCKLTITGGLNRPPMERGPGIRNLFRIARQRARSLGIELEESMTGGGSDGNFTAALGVPTLDGLGVVGEGAHAPHESILIERMADRTALLALLLSTPLAPGGTGGTALRETKFSLP